MQRLQKFNLTKPEVLMMINLGVGVKKTPDPRQRGVEAQNEDAAENRDGDLLDKVEKHINSTEQQDGAQVNDNEDVQLEALQEDNPDISVLNTIIEEMYERFSDADINEILQISGEILGGNGKDVNEVSMQDG
jgi:hypothetical protein